MICSISCRTIYKLYYQATVELAKMFVETVCEADRWMVQRSRTWCEMAGIKYFRTG